MFRGVGEHDGSPASQFSFKRTCSE
ncbi:Putative uncharacterized protein [Escherichia coli D6-117.29]|nr:Protein of unknown function [Escherichia coli D6-113.11]CDP70464.1 Protein of unknown function [Escherichia coli]CDP75592.1 Putative uncharacterized protein [Escherichia coli D6-117.29]CDU37170.1 Protein of unknown function [Escherichia coli D6-113.11]CDU37655.1 Protein of unknown function [Escherichia coli]